MTKYTMQEIQLGIEKELGEVIDHTNPLAVSGKINAIAALLSTGAQCIAESKRLELNQRGKWLRAHTDKVNEMKPSVAKEFVNTACIDEQVFSIRCERNYSALVHAGEFYRSILSMIKADMYQMHV